MIKKKQLVFTSGKANNQAGSKAPKDVSIIAQRENFEKVYVSVGYKNKKGLYKVVFCLRALFDWFFLFFKIQRNSIVLLQCPMSGGGIVRNHILKILKVLKNVQYISLIHDVALLRYEKISKDDLSEFNLMKDISDEIIVHNAKMEQWFIENGFKKSKIIILNIFDYIMPQRNRTIHFSDKVIIAGNLDISKSRYLCELKSLKSNFILYGPNYDNRIAGNNICYKGSFPPEELPSHINQGFGLIWDGVSIDTCSGNYGNYLRYNNPHKLSLFISSGIPVFIWKEAAEASFVVNNGLGFSISSLKDIDNILKEIDLSLYNKLLKNVDGFASQLVNGENTKNALNLAVSRLSKR